MSFFSSEERRKEQLEKIIKKGGVDKRNRLLTKIKAREEVREREREGARERDREEKSK